MKSPILPAIFAVLFLVMAVGVASAGITSTRIVQPDGTVVPVRAMDDWTVTTDGYAVVMHPETGWWCYAVRADDGTLAPGDARLGIDAPDAGKHLLPAIPARWSGPSVLRPSNL